MITNPINQPIPENRPWPVKLLALLFVLEAFGFIAALWLSGGRLPYLILGPAAALSALLLWLLWSPGWAFAILVQGVTLLVTLLEYKQLATDTTYTAYTTYPLMAFAIFMVIYLHNPDVRAAFMTDDATVEEPAI